MKKTILFSLLCLVLPFVTHAQEPVAPTLQIGLGGIKLTKATPDVEILASLIAKKQKDIKIKLVQNMILDRLALCGSTVYNYVDNTITTVITEKNEQVRNKNLLENTVNFAFTYAYAEFFVRTVDEQCCPEFFKLAEVYRHKPAELIRRSKATGVEHLSLFNLYKAEDLTPDTIQVRDRNGNIKRIDTIKYGSNKNKDVGFRLSNERFRYSDSLIAIILDMAAKAILENQELTQLGMMKTSYSEAAGPLDAFQTITDTTAQKYAEAVFHKMSEQLSGLIQFAGYYSCINTISETTSRSFNSKDVDSSLTTMEINGGAINTLLDKINTSLQAYLASAGVSSVRDSIRADMAILTDVIGQLKLIDFGQAPVSDLSNASFLIFTKALPAVQRLQLYSTEMFSIASDFRDIFKMLSGKLIANIKAIPCLEQTNTGFFTKLLGRLYMFDVPETYADFTAALGDFVEIFPDPDAQATLRRIISFVREYTIVKTDGSPFDPEITVDVVGFLNALEDIPYNHPRRVVLHATMGLNSAAFVNSAVPVTDGAPVRNFSYASEKIGVKFKLFDWKYQRSFGYGQSFELRGRTFIRTAPPREPVVSNMHVLLYGSGLLYNIVNTGTSKNFEYPLVGAGLGLTFYNDLDMNVSVGIPILPNQNMSAKYLYVGFGFDVSLTEYTKAVIENQKNKQEKKQVEEASRQRSTFIQQQTR